MYVKWAAAGGSPQAFAPTPEVVKPDGQAVQAPFQPGEYQLAAHCWHAPEYSPHPGEHPVIITAGGRLNRHI
jgi:hypothetical protein